MTSTLTGTRPARVFNPEPADPFEPFPQPRGWALNWDGPALGQPMPAAAAPHAATTRPRARAGG